jgi:hypothetical protein
MNELPQIKQSSKKRNQLNSFGGIMEAAKMLENYGFLRASFIFVEMLLLWAVYDCQQ